jgi:hypothetical protein
MTALTDTTQCPEIFQKLVDAYDGRDASACQGAPSRLAALFADYVHFKGTSWPEARQVYCCDILDYFTDVVQGRATQHLVVDRVSEDPNKRLILLATFKSKAEDYSPNSDKPVVIILGTNSNGQINFFESMLRYG